MSSKRKKLTDKRRLFVFEYLVDLNATQAAIRAGYSKKTARSQGQRLLTKDDIQKEIQKRQKKHSNKLEITADRVLKERARLAFFNVQDLYDDDGNLKDIKDLSEDLAAAIHGVKIGAKIEKRTDGAEELKTFIKDVKMPDKDKSLTALEKHLGLYEKDNEQQGNADLKTRKEFMTDLMSAIDGRSLGLPQESSKK